MTHYMIQTGCMSDPVFLDIGERPVKVYPAKDSMQLQNENSIVTCRLGQ